MKKLTNPALWVLYLSLVALVSCNDSSTIGADLLSDDELGVEFTDTITLSAYTVAEDSLLIWDSNTNGTIYQNFIFGDCQDPIFGRTVASIFAQIVPNTVVPDFEGATLDSVVLMLTYNEDLCYGNLDELFALEVYELDEQLDPDEDYYTVDSFAVKPAPVGIASFTPNVADSMEVLVPQGNPDTVITEKLPAHLRIRLENSFGQSLMQYDSATYANDTVFSAAFHGIWLKPTSQNAGLLNFAMRNSTSNLRVYYHTSSDTASYSFRIYNDDPVVMHHRNYYGGSTVEAHIAQAGEMRNDSFLFLQGLRGLNIELELPYIQSLNGVVINKAELLLPILSLPGEDEDFASVQQLYAVEVASDTSAFVLDDIGLPLARIPGSDFGDYFGGKPDETNGRYAINLTAILQRMTSGDAKNRIRLTPYIRAERANRVVLSGPAKYEAPAKLKVTYTKY